ncbi:hypothetical protein KY334_02210 [Candidatus Woesearchaeota archaeon]|nr:hypothetical protein [Candidatus Woesearchaeota archaeon]
MSIRLRANGRNFRRSGMDTDFYVGGSSFSTILDHSQIPQSIIDKMRNAYLSTDSAEISASDAKILARGIMIAIRSLKWYDSPYNKLCNWLMVCGGFRFND